MLVFGNRPYSAADISAVEDYVDYAVGYALVTFSMFLHINNADPVVTRAAIGTMVLVVGLAIARRLIAMFMRDPKSEREAANRGSSAPAG